jgi:tRNA C32,U32 (ribose-2'-O)-methylase TrmJ
MPTESDSRKIQFYSDRETKAKIERLTDSLNDIQTVEASKSKVCDFLLKDALDRAEAGEVEIQTLEGSVNFRDLLDHSEE